MFVFLAIFMQLICIAALIASLLQLPGNWVMVLALSLWAAFADSGSGPGWTIVIACATIALVGEVLEALAGAAAVSRRGASRRAMLLSVLLSMVGGLVGSLLIPIPIVGGLIGAVGGAAGGAFAGAWLGEAMVGSSHERRTEIGQAAMKGRLAGIAARMAAGIAIFLLQLISFF